MKWNIAAECTAALFTCVILFYSRRRVTGDSLRDNMFLAASLVTLFAIASNILSTLMLYAYASLPPALVVGVTTIYFVLTPVLPLFYIYYVISLLWYGDALAALDRRWHLISLPFAAYLILLIVNLWNGCVFRLDPALGYVQGGLINSTYYVFSLYCVLIVLFAVMRRDRIRARARVVIVTFPIVALIFVLAQVVFKGVILTGTASAFSLLVLLLYFQSSRIARDELTGLQSRVAFHERLSRLTRGDEPFTVLCVSLRGFKTINDRHGRRFGDSALTLAAAFLNTVSPDASAFRYSGDIFALLPRDGAEEAMDAILKRFSGIWSQDGIEFRLAASLSAVTWPDCGAGAEDVVSAMEHALAIARSRGPGGVARYESSLLLEQKRRERIAELMSLALREGGFEVYYQPIWDVTRHAFMSAEALLRMPNTPLGPIYPDEFIPIAEETGLIAPMTDYVLAQTCEFLRRLDDSGEERLKLDYISVNFPCTQFFLPDVRERVLGICEKGGVAPSRIKIEITERTLIEDGPLVTDFMADMSALGMRFSLDDFGTGFSNVSVILGLPFNCVKLDRSLVCSCCENPAHYGFIRNLVGGFHALGKNVVAEGVETQCQVERMTESGCNSLQGYYYARPMPPEDFERHLKGL